MPTRRTPRTKPKKTSSKRRGAKAKRTTKKARSPARSRKTRSRRSSGSRTRWWVLEALVWTAGVACGASIAGMVLWQRAHTDVTAFLDAPPPARPSTVWSAPFEVRAGTRLSLPALSGDLVAAGFQRVETIPDRPEEEIGLFTVTDRGMTIWRAPETPGSTRAETLRLTVVDGRVIDITPEDRRPLPPTPLAHIGSANEERISVDLGAIGPWLEPSLLAMEDQRFREHHGVDPWGLLRALAVDLMVGDARQGGSTLTQQLAKNLFVGSERSVRRKVREAFFAAALESHMDKDALLELYLSEVYLGQMGGFPLHGVHAASRAWFGTSPAHLDLHEAALIIGVIPAPNAYSPVRHPERALQRRNLVIEQLLKRGDLGADTAQKAMGEPLDLKGIAPSRTRRAPYAVDLAIEQSESILGDGALAARPHDIHTTINPLIQHAAEMAVAEGLAAVERENPRVRDAQVALVALRVRDGAIVAMVGGRQYASSAFNRATDARRQAGSTVKPLAVLAALDTRTLTPASLLKDEPLERVLDGKTWAPANVDGAYLGSVTVRQSLEQSRNIPAVHVSESLGLKRLQRFVHRAGLKDATDLPSAALGAYPTSPLEIASAYTAFANEGARRSPYLLTTVQEGSLVHTEGPEDAIPLAASESAAQVISMLEGVFERGTARSASTLAETRPVAGKTGTTDAYRDAWFVGVTPDLAIAVWVGRDRGTLGLSGSRAALPIWANFVEALPFKSDAFVIPHELERHTICEEDGLLSCPSCASSLEEWFQNGTAPDRSCGERSGVVEFLDDLLGPADESAEKPQKKPKRRQRRKR